MRKINIETKSTAEVVIPSPCYCKVVDKYMTKYIYYTDNAMMEIVNKSIYYSKFNDYNEISAARDYMDSVPITKEEFIENYNIVVNHLNSVL